MSTPSGPASDPEAARTPVFRVIRGGTPTAEELAALVAVLTAASNAAPGSAAATAAGAGSAWASRAAQLRRPLRPGPNAWRNSALPG